MLCKFCFALLHDHAGLRRKRAWELSFDHHKSTVALAKSLKEGCYICSALIDLLEGSQVHLGGDEDLDLDAKLSVLNVRQWKHSFYVLHIFRDGKAIKTFVFKLKAPWTRSIKSRSLASDSTQSTEVFGLAQYWTSRCNCANPKQEWYPDRLLDLQEVKRALESKKHDVLKTRVRLLENSEEWKAKESTRTTNNRYVTLSHCWGKSPLPLRLMADNIVQFLTQGLILENLPRTFQDATIFASHLEDVRYIWIDSLCIVQKSENDDGGLHVQDWHAQSAVMGKIYHQSYLNISATFSSDSSGGLFRTRDPSLLREDEIHLNVTGLPILPVEPDEDKGTPKRTLKTVIGTIFKYTRRVHGRTHLKKCTMVDVSSWEYLIDHAPVNSRGWVYQERLLAPRVLHFCKDQIAWECSELDCSERHPNGAPSLKVKFGDVIDENKLKSLDPDREGKMLREARLYGVEDPDKELPRLYTYELWRRIVEVFSQKQLSHPGDKLIALSGIAKHFFCVRLEENLSLPQLEHPYVAGLWGEYLESQLLWHVEPVFEKSRFYNQSSRFPTRAPSFSWAALDAPQGIVYGDFTDQDLLFKVKAIDMRYVDEHNKFGLLDGANCRLLLEARPMKVILQTLDQEVAGVPYGWQFVGDEESNDRYYGGVYSNIYLDSPDSDIDIFEIDARIFCVPAARGERTAKASERHLVCFLLQLQEKDESHRSFKRIGITKLSSYEEEKSRKALESAKPEDIYLY